MTDASCEFRFGSGPYTGRQRLVSAKDVSTRERYPNMKRAPQLFEYMAICLAKLLRCAFFFLSAAALSCLILDHLLWPLERIAFAAKERRHWAHIVDLTGLERAIRVDNGDIKERGDILTVVDFWFTLTVIRIRSQNLN